jgi:PAS domain S-box-containing protein
MDWSGKTKEELIAELERRERDTEVFAAVLEKSSQPFAVGTTEGRLTHINEAFCELTGYTAEELLADISWNETLTPVEWREKELEYLGAVIATGEPQRFEKEYIRKSGERIVVELLAQPAPNSPNELYAFVTDITARKRQEEERAKSEARYRHLIEELPSGVVHVSLAGEVTLANKEAQRVLGLSYDEINDRFVNDWEGETLREDGSICPVAEYPVSRCLMTGEPQGPTIVGVKRPDDSVSWALYSARPEMEDGVLVGAVVAFRDITERKRAEETVRLLSATIEQSPVSVMMTETDGTIIYVNAAFTESTGYASQEVIGANPRILSSGEHPAEYYEELWKTVLAGRIWRQDICNRRKNGELYWELMSIAPVRSDDGQIRHMVAMKVDDTERKIAERERATERGRLERELIRVSKLESLGVLAGGIAHDFNNVLTSIIANLSIASHRLGGGSPVHEILEAAADAAQRATGLTRQLLTFSKGGAPVKKLMSLHQLADSVDFVLHGSNVRCDLAFADDLWPVEADAGQLEQVLQNLVINADHAMPEGGVLEIRATNRELAENELAVLEPGPHIEISIKDEGCGISGDHLDRIFDPYFTTKQKGSGLGLATAFSIVKNHRGHMMVASELGQGTTFCIFLPARSDIALASESEPSRESTPQSGRILVMDDDAGVRKAAAASLEVLGYEVDAVADGAEAIDRYRAALDDGHPYGLVILDLTVPGGMGGLPTMSALADLDPNVRAIVSSGYFDDPVMANPNEYGFCGVVAKPFTFDVLTRAVEECMGS